MTTLSVVIPCYNEEAVLDETVRRLCELLARLKTAGKVSAASHVCLVDDGSADRTWEMIEGYIARGLPVAGIKLSRNQGHQNALLAGLFTAEGDVIVTMDADLQDDTLAVETMLDHHRNGSEIVYGVRRKRDGDRLIKRLASLGYYRLLARMSKDTVVDHADYRLMSRRAIEALMQFREVNLYLRGIVPLIGLRSSVVRYERVARFAGESKYPLRELFALALNGITSFSVAPLRLISLMGILVFFGTIAVSAWVLYVHFFTHMDVPGWASTALPIRFLGGIQLLSLSVIGEYLGKLYRESKARPRYIIEKFVSQPDAAAGADPPRPS